MWAPFVTATLPLEAATEALNELRQPDRHCKILLLRFLTGGQLGILVPWQGNRPDPRRGALAVLKQHPGMVLFAVSPAIILLGAVWWIAGPGWAGLLLVALVLAGGGCAAAQAQLITQRRK